MRFAERHGWPTHSGAHERTLLASVRRCAAPNACSAWAARHGRKNGRCRWSLTHKLKDRGGGGQPGALVEDHRRRGPRLEFKREVGLDTDGQRGRESKASPPPRVDDCDAASLKRSMRETGFGRRQ